LKEFGVDKLPPIDHSKWTKLFDFYDYAYSTRSWYLQEVNISKEAAALGGYSEIDFTLIALAAYWASYDPDKVEVTWLIRNVDGMGHALIMRDSDLLNMALRIVLAPTSNFECTDPWDKIYSTLDLDGGRRAGWTT
jgi:hypothetical protein